MGQEKLSEIQWAERFITNHNISDDDDQQQIYLIALENRGDTYHHIRNKFNSYLRAKESLLEERNKLRDSSIDISDVTIENLIDLMETSICLQDYIREIFDNNLTVIQKDILLHRFGLDDGHPMTLNQVGNIYHKTREEVRQIEAHALRKLRKSHVRNKLFKNLTDYQKEFTKEITINISIEEKEGNDYD